MTEKANSKQMDNYASETELIDRYLRGELDVAARLRVEERLTHDADFRQDVELQRALNRQLRLYNRLEMKKALQELHAQHAHEWTDEGEPSGAQRRAQQAVDVGGGGFCAAGGCELVAVWQNCQNRQAAFTNGPCARV